MNYFASKKEALITAVIAAFFVLITIGFTFEPLVTIILTNRSIPLDTTSLLVVSPNAQSEDIFKQMGKPALSSEIFNKADDFLKTIPISSIAIQESSAVIDTNTDPEQLVSDIRRFLSQLTPTDIKTILPDDSFMIETVIDPALVKISTGKYNGRDSWTFKQTNPQLVIQKNGLNSNIIFGNPQVGDNHSFERPIKCVRPSIGLRSITFDPIRKPLLSSIVLTFSAYFKDYSCFQSFSTFNN